jgi:hypothetical protein
VVGVQERTSSPTYICQPVPFGQNESYTAQELALLYGAADAEIVLKTEQESWRELSARKVHKMNVTRIDLEQQQRELPSPEAVFAQVAAAEAADRARER